MLDLVGVEGEDTLDLDFFMGPPIGRRGSRLCLVRRRLGLVDSCACSLSSSVSEPREYSWTTARESYASSGLEM